MMKAVILLVLAVGIYAEPELKAVGTFAKGLVDGLVDENLGGSRCVESFGKVEESWEDFNELFKDATKMSQYLYKFRDFTGILVQNVEYCKYSELIEKLYSLEDPNQLRSVMVRIITDMKYFEDNFSKFQKALADGSSYDLGFYSGKVLGRALDFKL
mmetsp:Transcript_14051/g.20555  ORF Transcript_14051/g.20555 Transcript_14051/m.20555 type:complete len:157 (-) Transcript_14051:25-495(-)|eukprot:CAMPEP_0202429266 /NCGR_PEP_ID=MMETSP1345-20130828/3067_1 /ASSEMBLY_ACC=CAM_ASM_000843 /TAXON_ID=342563 /ORGANISM="Fabrea Fabrea salina" /LENGTH=156 /DNA_ID=CAMNT_0049040465 /DNA_START=1033 /DNA_END=1503 /DNA_ORIENTATION=-